MKSSTEVVPLYRRTQKFVGLFLTVRSLELFTTTSSYCDLPDNAEVVAYSTQEAYK